MKKTIFVALSAAICLAGCKCGKGEGCSPATRADSAKATDSVKADKASAEADLVLKPTAEQIAKARRVGNKHCPTDGEKLGSMGNPIPVIYKGELVELCCGGCPGEFAKDPAKYLAIAKADTASN